MHVCYGCDPTSAGRFSFKSGGVLRVSPRFRGPPANVNGGFAAGMLACPALQPSGHGAAVSRITVRLRAGVPVERPLDVTATAVDGTTSLSVRDGDSELVSASVEIVRLAELGPGVPIAAPPAERAADLDDLVRTPVPQRPPWFEETGDHPIPGCFSCGPENPHGLYIYPRVVSDGRTCAPWKPSAEFDNGDGTLATAVLTSAIDCSSGICMPVAMQRDLIDLDQFFLLGSMDVRYLRMAPAGGAFHVAAKALRRDGRKFFGLSALVSDDGVAYAMAESTWIVAGISRTEAFG
jgi:hypothetical protein